MEFDDWQLSVSWVITTRAEGEGSQENKHKHRDPVNRIVISNIQDFSNGYSISLTLSYIVMRLRLYSWLSTAPPESLAGGLLESDQILI